MITGLSMKEIDQLVIFRKLGSGEMTQVAAAKALGFSTRWVRKKYKRYLKKGAKGLVHQNRERANPKSWPDKQKDFAMKLFNDIFEGFGPTFAAQKLEEIYNIRVSKETLRKAMINNGHWSARKRKPKHRIRRERKSFFGEMMQADGSPHDWFEGRAPKCTLLVFIDDATSYIPLMKLVPSESTKSVMLSFRSYVELFGRPLSLYVDFGSVFSVNTNNEEREKITQFKRACRELDVEIIHAHSPQAKGRVERSNQTHQDRLIKELRLANISTISEANEFIQNVYLPQHNKHFAIPADKEGNVHRPIENRNLELIFCIKAVRMVQNDFTLQYNKRILQLTNNQRAVVRPKEYVTVYEHFNNSLSLSIRNIALNFIELKARPLKQCVYKPEKYYKPMKDHPWRNSYKNLIIAKANGGY